MDTIISQYAVESSDVDVVYCQDLAYQKNMNQSIEYDIAYFENYVKRADTEISCRINQARIDLVEKYCNNCILDIGIGSGEFIRRSTLTVYGYDINPYGVKWLKDRHLFMNPYIEIDINVQGITLWDTLEHIKNPQELLTKIPKGVFLFVSLPTFEDFTKLKQSKHYKPNEHYYYFSINGFKRFMTDSGFEVMEYNDCETQAGREGITSFVCRRV
jgi:SAM-dependent methyltransferase